MTRTGLLAVLLLLLTRAAFAADPLIVISIDGFRADYLARGHTPALAALARDGARATGMRPSFPALTYPNHYTLVTGLYPDHHGVVNNNMVDESVSPLRFSMSSAVAEDPRWWEGATPLWSTAMAAGRVVANAGWPGSEGIVHGRRANYLDPWRDGRRPEEIATVALNWFDLPGRLRPDIEFLYFDDVDHGGHDFGPGSQAVNDAAGRVDAALGRLVAGLKRRGLFGRTNIVIVSDHGMADTANARAVAIDSLVPPAMGLVRAWGAVTGIDPAPGQEAGVARALLGRHPHAECWRKAEIPARFHYGAHPRVPAFVCLSDPGWTMAPRSEIDGWKKEHPGGHGYDPADPAMQALFVAHGPGFRKGAVLAPFDNVDVYPLLARLADLTPERNDGDIAPLLPALK